MVKILKKDAGAQVVTIVGTPTVASLESTGMKVPWIVRQFLSGVGKGEMAAAEAKGAVWSHLFLRPNGPDLEKLLSYTTAATAATAAAAAEEAASPETPKLRAVVDGTFSLDNAVAAACRNFSGKSKGKVVVQVVTAPVAGMA